MKFDQEKLSGFLDGELSPEDSAVVETALSNDPRLQSVLELMMQADTVAKNDFEAALSAPVPIGLAAAIRNAPEEEATPAVMASPTPASPRRTGWLGAAAAAVIALAVGGVGGYIYGAGGPQQIAAAPAWLEDIADYHRVYAAQQAHLVEVPASRANHIQEWLTKTVGADVRIPDLQELGLTFEGGRLLVAAGKPVAQLMFKDQAGKVVALCVIASSAPANDIKSLTINEFDMVSWGGKDANLVIVGDSGRADLGEIALATSRAI